MSVRLLEFISTTEIPREEFRRIHDYILDLTGGYMDGDVYTERFPLSGHRYAIYYPPFMSKKMYEALRVWLIRRYNVVLEDSRINAREFDKKYVRLFNAGIAPLPFDDSDDDIPDPPLDSDGEIPLPRPVPPPVIEISDDEGPPVIEISDDEELDNEIEDTVNRDWVNINPNDNAESNNFTSIFAPLSLQETNDNNFIPVSAPPRSRFLDDDDDIVYPPAPQRVRIAREPSPSEDDIIDLEHTDGEDDEDDDGSDLDGFIVPDPKPLTREERKELRRWYKQVDKEMDEKELEEYGFLRRHRARRP